MLGNLKFSIEVDAECFSCGRADSAGKDGIEGLIEAKLIFLLEAISSTCNNLLVEANSVEMNEENKIVYFSRKREQKLG